MPSLHPWMMLAHISVFLKRLKRPYKILLWVFLACIIFIAGCNVYVNLFSSPFLYNQSSDVPSNQYGLILGTSKYTEDGENNQYFQNRIKAAASLWFNGSIKQIICSGDNKSDKYYNEPKAMSKALINLGIPDSVIWLDKEGLSTRQSMQNFIENYDTDSVTIITQKFHNQRAVFLAHKAGLNAIGFIANDVGFFSDIKTHFREWFAKVKAVLVALVA